MKTKLGLLLCVPALLLSACGPKKVSYAEYKEKADEAAKNAETVTVTKLVIDNSGKIEDKEFKIHEVYTTQDGELKKDDSACTYEGDATTQVAAQVVSALAMSLKANAFPEDEHYEYAINPLTIYEKTDNGKGEMSFDKYGNLTKFESEISKDGKTTSYKLEVDYTYQDK